MFIQIDAGKSWLSTTWKLCKPLKTSDDVKDLKRWLSDVYANLAMINYPYATDFLAPVPANPISVSSEIHTLPYTNLNVQLGLYKGQFNFVKTSQNCICKFSD
jgi:hypothetical protein